MSSVDEAVAAIRSGRPVVLPFDTVYGLAADPYHEESSRRLYRLKRRDEAQPTALVAVDLDYLLECVPELRGRAAAQARELFPGPLTLVLPNPASRFRWIGGESAETIGVRVPELDEPGAAVLRQVGAVVATSANLPGGRDPRRVDEVPADIRAGVAAIVDGGELPGMPSTVVDLTGPEPRIIREGALPAEEVVRRLGPAVRSS